MAEGKKIPTGIIVGGGVVAAVIAGTLIYLATRAWAAPGEYMCPYCGAGPFPTLDKLNEHIMSEHPGERLVVEVSWE